MVPPSGLKLRPDKCYLFQTKLTFLGHVVSKKGFSPDPTNKTVNWPEPNNAKQVKQFVRIGSPITVYS